MLTRKLVLTRPKVDQVLRVKGADLASLLRSSTQIDPSVNYVMINESEKVPDFVTQLKIDKLYKTSNLPAVEKSQAAKSISLMILGN